MTDGWSTDWRVVHRAAVNRGQRHYVDPATGYRVMTELCHRDRGNCCGNGCRHCPYDHARVPPELRLGLPPPVVIDPMT